MSKILNQQLYSNVVYGSELANGVLRLDATSSATKGAVQAVANAFELIVASAVARITHGNTATRTYLLPDCSGEVLVSGRFLSVGDLFYGGPLGTAQVLHSVPSGALTTDDAGVPRWSSGEHGQVLTVGTTGVPEFMDLPDLGTIADAPANTMPFYATMGNDLVPLTTVANRLLGSPNGVPSWVLLSSTFLRSFNGAALGAGTPGFVLTATGDGGFHWTEPVSAAITPGSQFSIPYYSATGSGSTVSASQFLSINEASRALELRNQGRFRMYEATSNGTSYLEFRAPGSIGPNVIWVLPSTDGAANSSLVTDGFGNLSFSDLGSVGYGAASQLAFYAVNGNDLTNLATVPDRVLLSTASSSLGWSLISSKYLSSNGGTALTVGSSNQLLISNGSGDFAWADAVDVSGVVELGAEGYVPLYPVTGRGVRSTSFLRAAEATQTLTLDPSSSLSFAAPEGRGSVVLKARGALAETPLVLDLPVADGLEGHAVTTDGSGMLSFAEVGRGDVLPTLASGSLAYYSGTTPGGHGKLQALVSGPNQVMLSNTSSQAVWGSIAPKHLDTPVSTADNNVLTVESSGFLWKNPASLVGNVQQGVGSFVAFYPSDGREINDSSFLKVNELQKAVELRAGGLGIKFYDLTDTESVSLKVPPTLAESLSLTLPARDGTLNQALVTNGQGDLSFMSLDFIGDAEDGSYGDGLFTDFASDTKIGTAVDRFNEVLKSLAPTPAPPLSGINMTSGEGTEGKLTFGASAPVAGYAPVDGGIGTWAEIDLNGIANVSGAAKGIYAPKAHSGQLAANVSALGFAYPAHCFGDGDKGTLALTVNGSIVHSVNLASFASGPSANEKGSGFTLSAATAVKFSGGNDLPLFKYRTGTWTISPEDQRLGWNYLRVTHTIGSLIRETNVFEWVNDGALDTTTFDSANLELLNLSGIRYLSGVKYYTEGVAAYNVTVRNAYKNSYSSAANALSHPLTKNCALLASPLPPTLSASSPIVVSEKVVTIVPDVRARILGEDIEVTTQVLRTVQSSSHSAVTGGSWRILFEHATPLATSLSEDFVAETYRRMSSVDLALTSYGDSGVGPGAWSSVTPLSDGLLVYDGSLRYPTNALDSGDFRNVTDGNPDGPTDPGGPLGNPNYSYMSGEKVYLRYFRMDRPAQNFSISLASQQTEFVEASGRGSLTGNQVTLEVMAPNTTRNGPGMLAWKDCLTPYTQDSAVGAFASTFGSVVPTHWGVTLGTKSTATSGNTLLIRITAPDTWAGSISGITLTPL